jgi:hypothetical protein
MNKKTGLLAILVAMAVFAFLQARGGLFGVAKKDVRSAAFLGEVADGVNKQLPRAVDSETELASVAGLEGVFVYNYRLLNAVATEVDLEGFLASMRPGVTKAACTAPDTRDKFLKEGITLRYSYVDKSGVPIASFDVTRADCGI